MSSSSNSNPSSSSSSTPIIDLITKPTVLDRNSPVPYDPNTKGKQVQALDYRHFQRAGEVHIAMNIAKARERCRWAVGYLSVLVFGTGTRWLQTNKMPAAMLLPISAVAAWAAWEWDLGYGSKLDRVSSEASRLLNSEKYKHFGKF